MATMEDTVPGSGTGNQYIDSLLWGCGWSGGPIRYYFAAEGDDDLSTPGRPWQPFERQAFATAFALYENVANIQFQEVGTYAEADIVEWLVPSSFFSSNTTLGAHELPDPSETIFPPYGWYNFNHSSWSPTGLAQGGYGFITVIHELGHALGLAHPHDGGDEPDFTLFPGVSDPFDTGDFGLNQGIWTTMSYNDGWEQAPGVGISYGYQGTPMAFDIAALQAIYGANMTYHDGADVYVLPKVNASGTFWSCIWDAGGIDEISAAGAAGASRINLNDAPLTGPDAGGFVSWVNGIRGGFTIANGVTIENATGGNGNDTLTGNEVANILTGNAGNDSLDGGSGTDTLKGGVGNDTYVADITGDVTDETGGSGIDLVLSGVTRTLEPTIENLTLTGVGDSDGTGNALANNITGNAGANELVGDALNDTLTGNAGTDELNGGTGSDRMAGGSEDDLYWVDVATDIVTELAGGGTADKVKSAIDYTLGLEVEDLELIDGSKALKATGNALVNSLVGNNLNNTLDGKGGVDSMAGGAGDDTYIVDHIDEALDSTGALVELAGGGTDTVKTSVSIDERLAANVEILILTGAAAVGLGNASDNTIIGTTNANTLNGREGSDSLSAGAGNDTLAGQDLTDKTAGNDTLDGGAGADEFNPGAGDDLYIVDSAGDRIGFALDDGTDTVQSTVTWTLGSQQENLKLVGTGAINGTGNENVNVITGNAAANILNGMFGVDEMIGGGGSDTYIVDAFNEKVTELAGQGTDLVKSTAFFTLPDNVENLMLEGADHITGTGNTLNNVITGNVGSNTLGGAAGNDTLNGGDGNDKLDGGTGNDSMAGGNGDDVYLVDSATDRLTESSAAGGHDTVESAQSFTLGANVEDLRLLDDLGNNINGTGNTLNNLLIGNVKDNVLDGKTGADTMRGGQGNDTYIVDHAGDVVDEANESGSGSDTVKTPFTTDLGALLGLFENLTLTGTAAANGTGNGEANILVGNAAANQLSGLADNDSLSGGGGGDSLAGGTENDSLDGGTGADTMDGGAGDDSLTVDSAMDKLSDASGTDTIRSAITYSLALLADFENLTLLGTGALNATGNDGKNVLTGNDGANVLDGLGDDDALFGNKGNDTYKVDSAADQVIEVDNGGTDTVLSTANYILNDKNVENLTLLGVATTGTGNESKNKLTGTDGFNQLDGGGGADTLVGGKGNDTYFVDVAQDVITETSTDPLERDNVQSTAASYTLSANVEDLTLLAGAVNGTGNTLANVIVGNGGNNSLAGGSGNDQLLGNAGNDTLDGGTGTDILTGADGDDLYVQDSAADVIAEFGALDTGDELKTNQALSDEELNIEHYTFTGGKAVNFVALGADNRITGTALADTIDGGGGDNTLSGGGGADRLTGAGGNDSYIVDNALDKLTDSGGVDTVQSSVTFDLTDDLTSPTGTVFGAFEHLILIGTGAINAAGNDLDNEISGNSGANKLTGGGGGDTLTGGGGNDTLDGGTGNDTFRYTSKLDGKDVINSFDGDATGGQDVLNLDALFDSLAVVVNRAGRVDLIDKGSSVEVRVDADGSGGNGFELFIATINTADDITVGPDILVGT